jgi:phosphoglycolate phosphatase-like HAD superfamily hydrolase
MPDPLVLFDIDGTLVRRAGPHHREALVRAVREVAGLETSLDHLPLHGMLDTDIVSRMMRDRGAPLRLVRSAMPEIIRRAQLIYVRSCPDLRDKTCPGVRALLDSLRRRGILLGLVTGNFTRIGWKKLERAGLRRYFRFGAFSEMARDRAGLVRRAVREARERGWTRRGARIWLVGDSPNDILAARANGVQAIAVYTGISTQAELEAYAPDLLLRDLRALRPEILT